MGKLRLGIRGSLGSDAAAISGDNAFAVWGIRRADRSRLVLGWICPTFAISPVGTHPIPGITESTFVCHSPRRTSPLSHPSIWVHFTRGDDHLPLRVDQPRTTFPWIPIPPILP